jgi:hypothetical protein
MGCNPMLWVTRFDRVDGAGSAWVRLAVLLRRYKTRASLIAANSGGGVG